MLQQFIVLNISGMDEGRPGKSHPFREWRYANEISDMETEK